ncbi:extensin family protein [Devosia nitrariae]|uniref:Extensin-like C-terminal domain-containing protein n=1 Tax=Devosia nitrariae TaxID=2071872 RepID=A0ABQ5W005_9HYPH|nr:extensin family protein [Devosia nitrariae]GLQ53394.1 hypothetical protein GCM10010862_06520 [Devosia nitrariae]
MRFFVPTLLIAVLPIVALPAAAQDFLSPLEEMVENLAEEIAPRRPPPPPAGEPAETERAPVPRERPAELEEAPQDAPLPRPRPEAEDGEPDAGADEAGTPAQTDAPQEGEPSGEPEVPRVYQAACPAVLRGLIEAELLPPIAEGECMERSPLQVTGVLANGRMVPLSAPVTLNCQMASALPAWVETIDGYLRSREDTALSEISVGTSYLCRPRNNVEEADISEHGFANALDVTGFALEDGRTISLPAQWSPASASAGRLLRFAHAAACANFSTVLGPEANTLHEDHLHLDLGCHGTACRARICE